VLTAQNTGKEREATFNIYRFVIPMNSYRFANKLVQQKKEDLAKAKTAKAGSEQRLKESSKRLKVIEYQIAEMNEEFEKSNDQIKEYQE
jgi:hypothetical protein